MDMSMLAGVYSSLNAAANITKAIIGLRDASMIQEKVIELQAAILTAQQGAFAANEERSALIERIRELEADVARLKTWDAEKQRYKLESLPPGVFVYTLKPEMAAGEPAHYICQTCYQRGMKSILHADEPGNGIYHLFCHECGAKLQVGNWRPPRTGTRRGDEYWGE